MGNEIQEALQESVEEWAKIEKLEAVRKKKDQRIISKYCADNDPADIYRILKLLNRLDGLPSHDKETIKSFESKYPNNLSTKLILEFEDVKDIYSKYLEQEGKQKWINHMFFVHLIIPTIHS